MMIDDSTMKNTHLLNREFIPETGFKFVVQQMWFPLIWLHYYCHYIFLFCRHYSAYRSILSCY